LTGSLTTRNHLCTYRYCRSIAQIADRVEPAVWHLQPSAILIVYLISMTKLQRIDARK
jgi:hypothetical protein